jgi:hypothetical protein
LSAQEDLADISLIWVNAERPGAVALRIQIDKEHMSLDIIVAIPVLIESVRIRDAVYVTGLYPLD